MSINNSPLDQLRDFLNKLFQFETQDLDFGVYKILRYKREEIKQFIDDLLVNTVKIQLQTLTGKQVLEARNLMEKLATEDIIKGWLRADPAEKKILEKIGWEKIQEYQLFQDMVNTVQVSEDTENQIYNHLAIFFSRYYDKGDFISKRRFGKNEKYIVPYNGEETHFYWANHDQYYIKSSETFKKFSFKAGPNKNSQTVHFKLTGALTGQGNVKADENKYFVLSPHEPVQTSEELNIFFEYRSLTDNEKKDIGTRNVQDRLNEQAAETLEANLKKHPATAQLWDMENDATVLLKKLHQYTRKNQYDFFIHKNLKGFLQRELDFYIKSELLHVDDLYISETELFMSSIKQSFKKVKVFKQIADIIIDFLSQIEDFQKRLWEKKKFVLNTEWVITIDRLVAYTGEDAAKPIIAEVLQNKAQTAEWTVLFGKKIIPTGKLTIESLRSDLFAWPKLPIDTVHFSKAFKENLLNTLSAKIDLEAMADGLVIHSDNYHGLAEIQEKFKGRISPVYIDPPYNTDASAIIYKNDYKSSSFLSLISERVKLARPLLKKDSMICVAIDDVEVMGLRHILKEHFLKEVGIVAVRSNPAGRKTRGKFSPAHEYALFFGQSENAIPCSLDITEKRLDRYPQKDDNGKFSWANFIRSGTGDKREDRPSMYYPIYVSQNDEIRIPEMEYDDINQKYIILEEPRANEESVYPIVYDGDKKTEKRWQRGHERVRQELDEYRIRRDKNGIISIDFKTRMDENSLPTTWWDRKEYASANYGAAELKELFNIKPFDFPKARMLVQDCIRAAGALAKRSITLDFFPGSATTFDAVQRLNKDDNGQRKCILIEQGHHVYSIIIPRIKKIAYTFDWKDGKPKSDTMNGLGVFFKYQRLEQYEEALENISFTVSKETAQKALEFDQYIPKYFLEFETRSSQTLVNTEAMLDPWGYELNIWDGLTYNTRQAVDLVETFNYLIGLNMQKSMTREIQRRKYQFIYGNNNAGSQLMVVWRNTKNWEISDYEADRDILKEELKSFVYDVLYINGQAILDGYQPIEEIFKNKMIP